MSPRLSMEDVLERKRQQLMTLRAEKRKMQEKISKQVKIPGFRHSMDILENLLDLYPSGMSQIDCAVVS